MVPGGQAGCFAPEYPCDYCVVTRLENCSRSVEFTGGDLLVGLGKPWSLIRGLMEISDGVDAV